MCVFLCQCESDRGKPMGTRAQPQLTTRGGKATDTKSNHQFLVLVIYTPSSFVWLRDQEPCVRGLNVLDLGISGLEF
jgi:hypothetical protein